MTYTNKTQPTAISPAKYLEKNFKGNERVNKEALTLIGVYTTATGSSCVMWNTLFGFGKYYYKDSKGGEHVYFMSGFAISKTSFTLYNLMGWEAYRKEIEKLGTYRLSGKSCLAIKGTEDINLKVLKRVVQKSITDMQKKYKSEK